LPPHKMIRSPQNDQVTSPSASVRFLDIPSYKTNIPQV
jgi:hypothetical protein